MSAPTVFKGCCTPQRWRNRERGRKGRRPTIRTTLGAARSPSIFLVNDFAQEDDQVPAIHRLALEVLDDEGPHLLRVDRRDGQRDRLGDPQGVAVDESETATADGLLERGDQAAAIGVAADVGQPPLSRLADLCFVSNGQSRPSVLR